MTVRLHITCAISAQTKKVIANLPPDHGEGTSGQRS